MVENSRACKSKIKDIIDLKTSGAYKRNRERFVREGLSNTRHDVALKLGLFYLTTVSEIMCLCFAKFALKFGSVFVSEYRIDPCFQ